jgi:hypothetical protein
MLKALIFPKQHTTHEPIPFPNNPLLIIKTKAIANLTHNLAEKTFWNLFYNMEDG